MRIVVLVLGLLVAVGSIPPAGSAQVQSDSTYVVQSGDTLYGIARRFGVSVQALKAWNDLTDTMLRPGRTLRIRPPQDATRSSTSETAPSESLSGRTTGKEAGADSSPYGRHTVKAGDTFVGLALRLGTTADTLFALNDRTTTPLSPGRTLQLPPRFAPPTHVVKPGETLYGIAGTYGVSVRSLQAANDLDTTAIEPGRRLRLPGRSAPPVPPPGKWAAPDSTGSVAVYPEPYAGRLTASGAPYNPNDHVVSHPSLPYGSVVLLSRVDADRHTFARVIDRGPLEDGVLLDVSAAVADQLAISSGTTPTIALRTVWIED